MQKPTIWDQIKRWIPFGRRLFMMRPPLCGIHPTDQFRALIEHERRRSDRTGDRFAVVVFRRDESDMDFRKFCQFPDHLIQSVRSTDEVGWFDENEVGVLLLDTGAEGAGKFMEKLRERFGGTILHPSVIYVYPSNCLSNRQDAPGEAPKRPPEKRLVAPFQGQEKAAKIVLGLEPHLGICIPMWKRVFDIVFAYAGLVSLAPFLILVAATIKLVSPGPILFKQDRRGYLGKPFWLLKFRTMEVGTDRSEHEKYVRSLIKADVPMKKLDQHKNIIPFGRFLRSSGIDELPQLINVLRNEMSLVGPRPCVPAEFEEYLHWHKRRFYTLPGITGLWQVNGKHALTFKEMIRYDISYEQKRSFWLDFKIIIHTFRPVYRLSTDG